jgi:hypothetical protein
MQGALDFAPSLSAPLCRASEPLLARGFFLRAVSLKATAAPHRSCFVLRVRLSFAVTPADASDIAESVAFALLFAGKKRVHDSDRMMASIAAQRIVRHLRNAATS